MANRYETPFKEKLEQQYEKSLLEVLLDFRNKGMSLKEISVVTGFHYTTVRTWCARYGITMYASGQSFPPKSVKVRENRFIERFKAKTINTFNVLSRKW